MTLDLEPLDVSSLLANSLSIVREKAAAHHIRLEVDVAEGLLRTKKGSVLTNRIRKQLERLPSLKQAGAILSVSRSVLPPLTRDADASTDNILTGMATILEEAIQSQTIPEAAYHE